MNSSASVASPGQGTDSGYKMDNSAINNFFAELNAGLEVDQTAFNLSIESEAQKKFYSPIFNNQPIEFLKNLRRDTTDIFINEITGSFIIELVASGRLPKKLAFKSSHDKLYVWAEVNEDDIATEDSLIMVTASVNEKFQGTGFTVSLMYVEDRHELSIPSNYSEVTLHPDLNAKLQTAHKASKTKY